MDIRKGEQVKVIHSSTPPVTSTAVVDDAPDMVFGVETFLVRFANGEGRIARVDRTRREEDGRLIVQQIGLL